jgi:hypothetical protein
VLTPFGFEPAIVEVLTVQTIEDLVVARHNHSHDVGNEPDPNSEGRHTGKRFVNITSLFPEFH